MFINNVLIAALIRALDLAPPAESCSSFIWYALDRNTREEPSAAAGVQRPELPFLVVFSEESLPELVTADHDGTGWSHFDQPGQKTW